MRVPVKNRPPLSTGARLPWFSRVRALLAADRLKSRRSGYALGRTAVLWPLRTGRGSSTLGWCGSLGRQTVFHQPYVHAADPHSLVIVIAVCVAKSDCVHTVDGNFVFCKEVAINRLSQPLGTLDSGAA